MNNLIAQIVEIEKNAKNLEDNTQGEVEEIFAKAKKDCESTKKDILLQARAKVANIQELESKETNQKLDEIKMDYSEKKDKILQTFRENKTKWVDQVFDHIVHPRLAKEMKADYF